MKAFFKNYAGTLILLSALIVAYELATDVCQWLEPVLFPGLSRILPALAESLPELWEGLKSSMLLLLPAYTLALLLGIGLGIAVGRSAFLRRNLAPLFHGLSPIPPTLYIPYTITLLPTFWMSSFFIIFVGSFWPILNSTIHGVYLIERRYLDNARTLELSGLTLIHRVILPAALPSIFSGAGIGLIFSFILLTVAEMFGARAGLGFFVQYYADFSRYDKVIAGMLAMSVFIACIMSVYEMLKRRMLNWR